MPENKIRTVLYELFLMDRDMLEYVTEDNKDDYYKMLAQVRDERINEIIEMLNDEES